MEDGVIGELEAYIWLTEFQKRGLPHIHLLSIATPAFAAYIMDPKNLDKFVSAEMHFDRPQLYKQVVKYMLHGPCGELNPTSVCCNAKGVCRKHFPKEFVEETNTNVNGYPQYRRRDIKEDKFTTKSGHVLDNRWVVPYCPPCFLRWDGHANFEICATVKSCKYIYKYVFKGHDLIEISVREVRNEIEDYSNSRYVSSMEAAYRILGYPMHGESHSIIRLEVHLEKAKRITFNPVQKRSEIQGRMHEKSKLEAFFELNCIDPYARSFVYHDIPEHYFWNSKTTSWIRRSPNSKEKVLGRMLNVKPNEIERFALRLLLVHVKGPRSFQDLRTLPSNVVCATFHEAAQMKGLLNNEKEWEYAMTEAVQWQMPAQLRDMFLSILVYNSVANPASLWTTFKQSLAEDYIRRFQQPERGIALCYRHLNNRYIEMTGNNLSVTHIELLESERCDLESEVVERSEEPFQPSTYCYENLSNTQRRVFDSIIDRYQNFVQGSKSNCVYLDGPAGSGKTFLYLTLYNWCLQNQKKIRMMASSGVAASQLPNGATQYACFGLPINLTDQTVSRFSGLSVQTRALKETDMFIWDETPMSSGKALTAIDRSLQDMTKNTIDIFGGKFFVLGGDFRQVLPVVKGGGRAMEISESILCVPFWRDIQVYSLVENMRASDPLYAEWVLRIGNGTEPTNAEGEIEIPRQCIYEREDMVNHLFGDVLSLFPDNIEEYKNLILKRVILAPTNRETHQLNDQILSDLEGPAQVYTSEDSVTNYDGPSHIDFPVEYLNTLTPTGLPLHTLTLKRGAVVMLLRNLNLKSGLCNGTRLMVLDMKAHVIMCEILTGVHKGDIVSLPRINIEYTGADLPFTLTRKQFPVRLCFAMTINKAQGQTFERVGVLLVDSVFGHGQLYVAFSRTRSFQNLFVVLPTKKTSTKNVVYDEVLTALHPASSQDTA